MSWHDKCHDFDSRVEASADDENFHDVTFLLLQEDAENNCGDEIGANKHLLALISPVFYAQFYGPLAVDVKTPIEIVDGTAQGFKQTMDFINHPKSFQIKVAGVEDVFEVLYFAHKYQIGPLVSYCRSFLGSFGSRPAKEGSCHGFHFYFEKEEALDILQWARFNSHFETTFKAEYSLLVQACWEKICVHFKDIFKEGNIGNEKPLPKEELMMEIFDSDDVFANESFVLSVALNYFIQLIDGQMESLNQNGVNKRFKIDKTHLWSQKLKKITKAIDVKKVSPSKISDIIDKVVKDKIPASIIDDIVATFTASENSKTSFEEKNRSEFYYPFIDFDLFAREEDVDLFTPEDDDNDGEDSKNSDNDDEDSGNSDNDDEDGENIDNNDEDGENIDNDEDGENIDNDDEDGENSDNDDNDNDDSDDTSSLTSSEIEFGRLHTKKVGEATMKFTINENAILSGNFIEWEDNEFEAITFQNGSDYEEIVKEEWQGGLKFFAKENTPITLTFKVLRHKEDIFMYEVNKSNFSYNSFHMNILEVNGKPVSKENKMCYCPLKTLCFQPVQASVT